MYIDLYGSSDRLGGNIVDIISQIIYAINNNLYIKYNRNYLRVHNSYNQGYNSSIFMQTLFDIIDKHNNTINDENFSEYVELAASSHYELLSRTVLNIRQDLVSYFLKNLFTDEIRENFLERAKILNYEVPFDPKKTILIHHRLEDAKNRPDIDGSLSANFLKDKIEDGIIPDNNIFNLTPTTKEYEMHIQVPLSTEKLKSIVEIVSKDKPNHEIVIVSTPNENLSDLPYRYLSSHDEFYDLFLLCNSETSILSRSNYALSSLFFGMSKNTYIPLWTVVPCYGLYTKYDNNNFNFFP
jgi:hypothetical protein